ncbi:ABC transporter ATP-binding protein [Desulforamulus ruminis]|uniref:ABC transporter related protein n=1 Tax=Desulforamulus ruminis (strain ATCC 23193 / DSM 2154 / NCIMB 8452 / DL) TaxID=696281 RepID=F6DKT2_DESRL|nr:ABC transporter ATP-binding protein [Desulforamulus ruminis]AEG60457.1 ABC transporter related protein [Desulforamulus ruminis DSM 2154]
MQYAIEVEQLTKKFGEFVAVDNISFKIPRGSVFGFLGPNGSGKSTTIRMLCGVLTPTSGKGLILGKDIVAETEEVRQNLGYMSQRFSLYEELTVNENLDFYAGVYGLDAQERSARKEELIHMANLKGKEKSLARNLSGGWKQRLALGCALIHKPRLLILDEPTAGVDPVARRVFWEIIHGLAKQGITVLVTTHYMDEAASCDIVGFIFDGKMINIASPKELIQQEKVDNLEDIFITYVETLSGINVHPDFTAIKFLSKADERADKKVD